MAEDGETNLQAAMRELREETNLEAVDIASEPCFVYDHLSDSKSSGRADEVLFFKVHLWRGALKTEPGCTARWLSREELLEHGSFPRAYAGLFAQLPRLASAELLDHYRAAIQDLLGGGTLRDFERELKRIDPGYWYRKDE